MAKDRKNVTLDEDALAILDSYIEAGCKSYSKAVIEMDKRIESHTKLVRNNFKELNNILLTVYEGNAHKAAISEQLMSLLIQAMKDDHKYKQVSKEIDNILMNIKK